VGSEMCIRDSPKGSAAQNQNGGQDETGRQGETDPQEEATRHEAGCQGEAKGEVKNQIAADKALAFLD